ncbi:hypothetical protein L1987_78868 [Smallanthus sonchifolius]|uniref:Uncharacterized protein n=1 Tax=Smallanthus sonchifolius TaxID=185202 RepID=A0ACB8ZEX4_9ASTR|nr:hypothetical protein L1987_78868 [Smallanthus sonchifolius]
MASSKVTLKLLIDKKGQRVLFAEAGKDFVDFLFSLLALPVGTVIRLLDNHNMVGGMAKLYQSVSDLNDDYIQSNQNKDVLVKPKFTLPFSPQVPLLSTEAVSSPSPASNSSTVFYKCMSCNNGLFSTSSRTCAGSYCSRTMSAVDIGYVLKSEVDAKGGGFVKGLVTYMVMDDLAVSPMSTISSITVLNKFNINDLGALEEKVVHIGMNEGLELLKHSLNSRTVLTDVFLTEVVVKDENLKKV